MKFENQLNELVQKDVISDLTANKISKYYEEKHQSNPNRILVAFGILGSLIGGLGIILILAHNWDMMGVWLKTIIAFFPLLVGQFLCGLSLFKKKGSVVWSESSSIFLFIAIGACMSLISQTYHIQGELSPFILTWMLLGFPLIYLMKSSSVTILFIVGVTFCSAAIYGLYGFMLLLGIIPHLLRMHKSDSSRNFMSITYWFLSISLLIGLGAVTHSGILIYIAYFSFLGVLYNYGHSKYMAHNKFFANGPRVIGGLGIIGMLFFFSFDVIWSGMIGSHWQRSFAAINWSKAYYSLGFIFSVIFSLVAAIQIFVRQRRSRMNQIRPISLLPFVFIIVFSLGYYWSFSQLAINLLILLVGILTIIEGAKKDHLGILNKGLAIIMILTVCRFFDTQISFVLKGAMFMIVGVGLIVTNYIVVRRRKKLN